MAYNKYLIWAPGYRRTSAGIVVLHKLCHLLSEKGLTAYVTGKPNSEWNEKYADPKKIKELVSEDAIVVYPEVVSGNPFFARFVVRYILNKPGLLGGTKRYSKHELLFAYFYMLGKNLGKKIEVLEISYLDLELFNDDSDHKRAGIVFYVGKGSQTSRIRETESATEITREYPPTHEELAELFKKSELFYSYDNCTGLTSEARLCGCPVVIIPDSKYSKEEVLAEGNDLGLSYGLGDIEHAKATVHQYGEMYRARLARTLKIDDFINVTQDFCKSGRGYSRADLTLEHIYLFLIGRKKFQRLLLHYYQRFLYYYHHPEEVPGLLKRKLRGKSG